MVHAPLTCPKAELAPLTVRNHKRWTNLNEVLISVARVSSVSFVRNRDSHEPSTSTAPRNFVDLSIPRHWAILGPIWQFSWWTRR